MASISALHIVAKARRLFANVNKDGTEVTVPPCDVTSTALPIFVVDDVAVGIVAPPVPAQLRVGPDRLVSVSAPPIKKKRVRVAVDVDASVDTERTQKLTVIGVRGLSLISKCGG